MELDIIKLQTTWNDAAGSLNNNFAKIQQAINTGSGGADIDTSKFATTAQLQELDNILSDEIDGLKDSKQDKINDLETIRSGAALGATALQEHQDISHLATKSEVNSKQDTLVSGTNIKTINGESILGEGNIEIKANVDTSNLATKEELESLTNEMIANEEVVAAALNDLDVRVKEVSANVSGETATKVELQDAVTSLTNIILENEEITAAALNDLNTRLNEILTRLNNAGI